MIIIQQTDRFNRLILKSMGGKHRGQPQRARSSLREERWFEPAFGVVHRVRETDELDFFFDDLQARLDELPKIQFFDDRGAVASERDQVKLFSPARLSLRVVERRLTNGYGKRNRFVWNPADRARIQQHISDEIGRYDLGGRVVTASMCEVHRLGDPDVALEGGRVLALTPGAESEEAEFFATEHEIAVNELPAKFKKFRTTAPYLPHVSIGRIHREATPQQVGAVVGMIRKLLPLELALNPVEFTPKHR